MTTSRVANLSATVYLTGIFEDIYNALKKSCSRTCGVEIRNYSELQFEWLGYWGADSRIVDLPNDHLFNPDEADFIGFKKIGAGGCKGHYWIQLSPELKLVIS